MIMLIIDFEQIYDNLSFVLIYKLKFFVKKIFYKLFFYFNMY